MKELDSGDVPEVPVSYDQFGPATRQELPAWERPAGCEVRGVLFFLFHGNQQTSEFLRSGLVLSDIASTFCFFDLWVKFKEKKYRWKNHPFDWCFVDVRCLEPPAREAEFALHWMVCIFDLISPDGSRSRTPCAIWKSCGRGVLRVWEVGCWTGTPRKINDDERLCHLGAPLYYWSKL